MRFSFGEYQLDTEARSLQRSGQAVHVEPKVFDLLAYLIKHRERVASPDELLEALWSGAHVSPAALTTAVRKAREAVGDNGAQKTVLRTKHGHGFQFVAELRKRSFTMPIVVVTAKDLTDEERRKLSGEVEGLVQKRGTGRDEFLSEIRDLVAKTVEP